MLQTGQKYAPQIFKLGQTAKGAGTFPSAGQSKKGNLVLALLASDFHETFTRSSLALNMSRKLLSDPYLAIHCKIMAKNGYFFLDF